MSNQTNSVPGNSDSLGEQNDATAEALDAAFSDAADDTIEKLESQLAEAVDRELKAQAELENFRKRIYRETEQTVKYASLPLIRDLLEVLDNLTRATDAASNSPDASGLLDGVKMVQQQMIAVFAKHHCKPIPSLGSLSIPTSIRPLPNPRVTITNPAGLCSKPRPAIPFTTESSAPSHVIVSTGKAT